MGTDGEAAFSFVGRTSNKALDELIQETDRLLYITDPLGPEARNAFLEQWYLTRKALDRVYREAGVPAITGDRK